MSDQMTFDGDTYEPWRDRVRLTRQWWDVWVVMLDGRWRTLKQLAAATGWPEASISARLRDFRKARFGSHTVQRSYIAHGLWTYRLIPNPYVVVTRKDEAA